MRRRLVPLLVAAVAVAPFAAVAAPAPAARCGGGLTPRNDGWQQVAAPVFPAGPTVVTGWAANAADPRPQYVTNGVAVLRSPDAGCTWRTVLTTSTLDPRETAVPPRVTEVGVARTPSGEAGYAVVSYAPAGTAPVGLEVHLTYDGGATWARADNGLPPVATPVHVAFETGARTGYALLRVAARTVLYVTADAGTSWAPAGPAALDGFALGTVPGEVWGWDGNALLRSADAGATFAAVPGPTGRVTALAVPPQGLPVAFTQGSVWRPGAGRWTRAASPGNVTSAAYDGRSLVASGPDGMWLLAGRRTTSVGPVGEHVRGVVLTTGTAPEVWGWTAAAVFHGTLGARLGVVVPVPRRPLPRLLPITLHEGHGPLPTRPGISGPREVALPVGGARTVRYDLDLPPVPTPVDVDFVIDTTNSFAPIIAALRAQLATIVNRLTALRIDAQFGVGAFREYPLSAYTVPADTNYPYKLVRTIGPADESLEDALYSLSTGGGTTDGRTSALAAAYQAATGAGQAVAPTDKDAAYVIPRGLDARFRPGSLRVLLLVTDTEPRAATAGYPGPSVQQVGDALAARRVLQAGLVVGSPPAGTPGPRRTMEDLAERTGAVATGNGVDCDGDGQVDIEAGSPLVCDLAGDGLASAIVELLRGVRDRADIGLTVQGDARAVAPASALTYQDVDIKAYHRLGFDVRYSCTRALAGQVLPVRLTGRVADAVVATTTVRLRCVPPVPPAPPAPPPPVVPAVVVAAAAPAPPAPPPHVPNVNPNPNLNPNPQVNPNAQAGAVGQEQERPQLATVENELPDTDLAMTGLERAFGGAAVLAMGCAYGVATRRRTSVVCARASN